MPAFWVPGIPKPQGSKRAFVNPKTNRAVIVEDNTKTHDWRSDVQAVARQVMAQEGMEYLSEGPVSVHLGFVMPRPKSTPKGKPTPPAIKKPDLDKLCRAIFDAVTGVIYADDSQVVAVHASKRIAELDEQPGCNIIIGRRVDES